MSDPVVEETVMGHKRLERNITLLAVATFITVSIGGLVQITPLFYLENTIEEVEGVRPYTPLEQAGRDIYIREGCYTCHSQMVRPFRDEVERYGHYSLAAESMYDHPFQWGSKRTGPDLARVGGRYSDEWHVQHLENPQSVVPESVMPSYGFLLDRPIEGEHVGELMATHRMVGVPYTDEQIAQAGESMQEQGTAIADRIKTDLKLADDKVKWDDEIVALTAYLQSLGRNKPDEVVLESGDGSAEVSQ